MMFWAIARSYLWGMPALPLSFVLVVLVWKALVYACSVCADSLDERVVVLLALGPTCLLTGLAAAHGAMSARRGARLPRRRRIVLYITGGVGTCLGLAGAAPLISSEALYLLPYGIQTALLVGLLLSIPLLMGLLGASHLLCERVRIVGEARSAVMAASAVTALGLSLALWLWDQQVGSESMLFLMWLFGNGAVHGAALAVGAVLAVMGRRRGEPSRPRGSEVQP